MRHNSGTYRGGTLYTRTMLPHMVYGIMRTKCRILCRHDPEFCEEGFPDVWRSLRITVKGKDYTIAAAESSPSCNEDSDAYTRLQQQQVTDSHVASSPAAAVSSHTSPPVSLRAAVTASFCGREIYKVTSSSHNLVKDHCPPRIDLV